MKRIHNLFPAVFIAASLLASCAKDASVSRESHYYTFEILGENSTKSFLSGDHIAWEENDTICCCIVHNGGNYFSFFNGKVNPGHPSTFTIYCKDMEIVPGDVLYTAAGIPSLNYWEYQHFNIPSIQISSELPGALKNIPQTGNPYVFKEKDLISSDKPISGITFCNVCSFVNFDISAGGDTAGETILSVELSSETPLSGKGSIAMTTGEVSFSEVSNTVAVTANGQTASKASLTAAVLPCALDSFTIEVKTDKASYVKNVKPEKSLEFQRSHQRKLIIDLSTFERKPLQAGFIPYIIPLDFGQGITYEQDNWISLGTGELTELFLFSDTAPVEIQQSSNDPSRFRVVAPFDGLLEKADVFDPSYPPAEYLYFRTLPMDGINVTQPDLVYFDEASTGYFDTNYNQVCVLLHPGWFYPDEENEWQWSRVLSTGTDGIPAQVQLAPIYYLNGIGFFQTNRAGNILITFPEQQE